MWSCQHAWKLQKDPSPSLSPCLLPLPLPSISPTPPPRGQAIILSPYISSAMAPKPKTVGLSHHNLLSNLNYKDTSTMRERQGCFHFLLPSTTASPW